MPCACFALFFLPLLLLATDPARTRNIILVIADGLRWQDLFRGIDPLLADEKSVSMDPASKDADDRRRRYATRETLAPFFWTTITKSGLVLTAARQARIRSGLPSLAPIRRPQAKLPLTLSSATSRLL